MWSERQQGLGEEAGRGKRGSRVSFLSLPALRSEGGKTERSSIVEERAVEGQGNDTSFPVFCSDLQLDMNLQGGIVQRGSIAICSCCGLNSLHLFPSSPLPGS